jgi:hypothetical protein
MADNVIGKVVVDAAIAVHIALGERKKEVLTQYRNER